MRKETSRPPILPRVDTKVLVERLASLRGALGATRLGVARRLTAADGIAFGGPFEVLAVVDLSGELTEPEAQLPLGAFRRLLDEPRLLEVPAADSSALGKWLRQHGGCILRGWPLPNDRAVSVMAVAMFDTDRTLGSARWNVARAGLEALGRALAPPSWVPLASHGASPPRAGSDAVTSPVAALAGDTVLPLRDAVDLMERIMIQRALQCSEGNKSAAARTLRLSRQGLYKKLRRHGLA